MKPVQYTYSAPNRRNEVAQAMLDRNGPFKPKSAQKAKAFKRKPKYVGRGWE